MPLGEGGLGAECLEEEGFAHRLRDPLSRHLFSWFSALFCEIVESVSISLFTGFVKVLWK